MGGAEDSLVRPVAGIFASTLVLPQLGPGVPARSAREIKFVAYLVDLLLEGKVLEGLDVLCQRLKALETAHAQDGEAGLRRATSSFSPRVPRPCWSPESGITSNDK
jgi:hypothetical protein